MITVMTQKKDMSEPQFRPQKQSVTKLRSADAVLPTDESTYESRKIMEIGELLWLHDRMTEAERNTRILRALELYEDLEPQGAAEGMLAAQMVGTHAAALDCLRRAALQGQNDRARDVNLKHAQKLMVLYSQQMGALNKHRGRGQQKVTVEHVHVHSGGQAIVGNVERGGEPKSQTSRPALPNAPAIPLAPPKASKPSKSRRRS